MRLDAEDLLAQIKNDYPEQYRVSQLQLMVNLYAGALADRDREIERLNGLLPTSSPPLPGGFGREETLA